MIDSLATVVIGNDFNENTISNIYYHNEVIGLTLHMTYDLISLGCKGDVIDHTITE